MSLGVPALLAVVCLPSSAPARDLARLPRLAGRLIVRERAGLPLAALQNALRVNGAQRVNAVAALGATVLEAPEDELSAIEAGLRRSGLFKSVERDYLATITEEPNDPYYGAQWGVPRIGAPAAWALSSGAGVVVAVVDTGVDDSHPDLLGQVLPGYDFVNDDADARDDHGHGTRMTGVIAARRDNAVGIAGVAPDAMVLPVKVLDAQGYGAYSAVASGITYAVDHGARVVNLSLAGPVQSDILQDAVDYAAAHEVVVVAASGNDGTNAPEYPAAASGAVAVGAIDASDARPAFSNYGAWIGFAAPGVDIVTTSLGAAYASSSGTSPAAAFGSGVFALLFAATPTLTRSEAIQRVQSGAVDLGNQGWDAYFGWGRADAYGALVPGQTGAVPPDETPPDVVILSPAKRSLVSGLVPVDVAANDNIAISRVELFVDNRWYATATSAPYQFAVDAGSFEPGQHRLRAHAYDASQNFSRTKSLKVAFTPGAGLLVGHAVAKSNSVSIKAEFALPDGIAYEPSRDGLMITLTSADGTVLSATASAGTLTRSASGKLQGSIVPAVPSAGDVRLTTKSNGAQPLYALKIKASRLSGMRSLSSLMNLGIQIGSAQLSQSLTFRAKGSTLVYP
jgi:hypothetical protein